ncbi:hypothetical protein HanOQP8_Chr13g0499491 [Helianthus annuus]|nr:hypothetical protein HanOQP8_Chr13g0499491 [Helianthus annuus]
MCGSHNVGSKVFMNSIERLNEHSFYPVFMKEALVVCRLRRNGDFRVNESPRGSSDHRISPVADNDHDHSATNECTNNTQIEGDGFDDENAIKSCSLESKSSYRSHSVEQNDSESVSDQQLIDDFPDGFSTPYKVSFLPALSRVLCFF